jgi:hypothetical protein
LLTDCPELGWLRDITDAGKHRGLGRLPEVKGAEPHNVGGRNIIQLGIVYAGTLKFFLVLNDESNPDMDVVLRAAVELWRTDLKAKNLPSPFA